MNKNNFSYWFPKIEFCGIKVPKSKIFIVPEKVHRAFYQYDSGLPEKEWNEIIDNWLEEVFTFMKEKNISLVFNKNALFSNKFNFSDCISNKQNLKGHILDINYESIVVGANGYDELILREIIQYDPSKTATIYNGMPLRNEFRTFYDFDKKRAMYTVNYWDYDFCKESMEYDLSNKIIFNHEKNKLLRGFSKNKDRIELLVSDKMKEVQLEGIWSIDTLIDENNDIWLIDMALAEESSYWKESKVS